MDEMRNAIIGPRTNDIASGDKPSAHYRPDGRVKPPNWERRYLVTVCNSRVHVKDFFVAKRRQLSM